MDEESLSLSEISDRISPYLDQSLDSNDVELLKLPTSLLHKSGSVVMMEENARTGFEAGKFPKEEKFEVEIAPLNKKADDESQDKIESAEKIIDFDSEKIQFKKGILMEGKSQEDPYKDTAGNIVEECSETKKESLKHVAKIDCTLIDDDGEITSEEKKEIFEAESSSDNLMRQTLPNSQLSPKLQLEETIGTDTTADEISSEIDSKVAPEPVIKPYTDKNKSNQELKNIAGEEARMGFDTEKMAVDDDSVSSMMSQKSTKRKFGEIDEDSVSSMASQRSNKRKFVEEDSNMTTTTTNADALFEYQWPLDQGDYFMIQEQVSEFLGIKSFKRKYPELFRRSVEMDEREYLRERIAVSETQLDLGLTAVKSEDVIELMAKDYPEKYQEYERVVQDRESKLKMASRKVTQAPNVVDKTKISELVQRTVQAAAEYNARFNQERREGRKGCVDLQTRTIHYPIGKMAKKYKNVSTNYGKYPLALIPGQFQEYYKTYTSSELKYLPLNTVVYGPPPTINGNRGADTQSDDSLSDSDDSSSSGESSSSQDSHCGSGDSVHSSGSNKKSRGEKGDKLQAPPEGTFECRVCHKWEENEAVLVQCSDCKTRGHPSCLQLTNNMVTVIKTYQWQCMECKSCVHCENPYDEDKMMFCDKCDRGYHTFCVGVRTIPSGRWICKSCGQCATCGAVIPGPEGSTRAQWQNEYAKNKNGEMELVRTLCITCAKLSENKVTKTPATQPGTPQPGKRPRGRPRKIVPVVIVPEKEIEIPEKEKKEPEKKEEEKKEVEKKEPEKKETEKKELEKNEGSCSVEAEKDSSEVETPTPRRNSRRGVTDEEK